MRSCWSLQCCDNGNTATASAHCPSNQLAAGPSLALITRTGSGGAIQGWYGTPDTIATSTRTLAPPGSVPSFQTSLASATRMAFDVQPGGLIEQWPFDAATLTASTNTTGAALLLDFLEGDDVYAWSIYGTAGWMQEYRVTADGKVVLFRSKPNTQISGMGSDGTTIVWCESYGSTSASQQEPTVELWSAPYTNDPTVLATTAKKVVSLPFTYACSSDPVVFQGYFASTTLPFKTTVVIRLSDGAIQQVSSGAGWGFANYALVGPTELWSTMNVEDDAGNIGFSNVAFARYTLGPWP